MLPCLPWEGCEPVVSTMAILPKGPRLSYVMRAAVADACMSMICTRVCVQLLLQFCPLCFLQWER